jgi:hypothetical protein
MRHLLIASSLLFLCHCDPSDTTEATSTETPDGGTDAAVVTTCTAPAGPGTEHNGDAITADTTWRAADGPHFVTFGFQVKTGATLTIEPCAEVRFKGSYGLTIEGKLIADGTDTHPRRRSIRFLELHSTARGRHGELQLRDPRKWR